MKRTTILLVLLALLFLVGNTLAMHSDNYLLDWYVLLTGGGGGPVDSTNYAANFTIGQTARGLSSSANYTVGLGYWYGTDITYSVYLPLTVNR